MKLKTDFCKKFLNETFFSGSIFFVFLLFLVFIIFIFFAFLFFVAPNFYGRNFCLFEEIFLFPFTFIFFSFRSLFSLFF